MHSGILYTKNIVRATLCSLSNTVIYTITTVRHFLITLPELPHFTSYNCSLALPPSTVGIDAGRTVMASFVNLDNTIYEGQRGPSGPQLQTTSMALLGSCSVNKPYTVDRSKRGKTC